jgi:hypothetical protein
MANVRVLATGQFRAGDPQGESNPQLTPPSRPLPQASLPDERDKAGKLLRLRLLPNPKTCRAKPAGFGDYTDCLVECPFHCPYALPFGDGFLCRHPQKHDIVQRTIALQPPPKASMSE